MWRWSLSYGVRALDGLPRLLLRHLLKVQVEETILSREEPQKDSFEIHSWRQQRSRTPEYTKKLKKPWSGKNISTRIANALKACVATKAPIVGIQTNK
mmetsp:Transcript_13866/g.21131  ORF Transcript_13866/g.21131 Transcript_13866/m.21131 type:complete len:98 (-) Transcript_13866:1416-1709(-)